jgi:hypothetical protein
VRQGVQAGCLTISNSLVSANGIVPSMAGQRERGSTGPATQALSLAGEITLAVATAWKFDPWPVT